jgi:hypothetical protein
MLQELRQDFRSDFSKYADKGEASIHSRSFMFKGLFQFIFGLIRLVLFLAIFVVIFHTWVIKQALTFSLSHQRGADIAIQAVKMDWKNTGFEIHGLEIGNPYSFPRGTLADIPLVIVSVDLPSLSHGLIRLKALGFNLRELQAMNVPQKGLNLLALKVLQKKEEEGSGSFPRQAVRDQIKKYSSAVMIDELVFSIGDISYLDMSGSYLRQNRYHAGIRAATYYDVRGTEDVVGIVASEALKKMGMGYLGVQLQKLQGRYLEEKAGGILGQAFSALKETFSS